ncbi:MAG TPA: hypothetical protein VFX48_00695, partial [Saprospiraceae bacterium]|nr:hypothetical protein [Saprospiraceae bacterium]
MKSLLAFGWFACLASAAAQGGVLRPMADQKRLLDRFEIKSGALFQNHLQLMPLDQENTVASIRESGPTTSQKDSFERSRFLQDQVDAIKRMPQPDPPEQEIAPKAFLKYFYRDGSHFLSWYGKDFQLSLDPLLHLEAGGERSNSEMLLVNRRGLRLQGAVDDRFFFYSEVLESQISSPAYISQFEKSYKSLPGAGLYKNYKSGIWNINKGYDFLLAEGALSWKMSKHLSLTLGHGRHFIGSGFRSLFLSDFAPPQFYLKLNTSFWRLHYQSLFTELSSESLADEGNRLLGKKYMVNHYLSVNITKNWNAGLFESVVFGRSNGFELQYLNPVILYRFVEHAIGSPDNVFLGFHSNLLLAKRFSLYGQCLFDEFIWKELFSNKGWWGNKYGIQAGMKYLEAFGLKDLDLQLEYNTIRPYTYTFRDSVANYSHSFQSLAHPLGANFREWVVRMDYHPGNRLAIHHQW